jgi:hypothetical protein
MKTIFKVLGASVAGALVSVFYSHRSSPHYLVLWAIFGFASVFVLGMGGVLIVWWDERNPRVKDGAPSDQRPSEQPKKRNPDL